MEHVLGIDLGTTFSAVAALNALGRPEVLPNRDGERITPSVVLFNRKADPLVGSAAKRSAPLAPWDVAQFAKRHMGDPDWTFQTVDGGELSAEEISSIILRQLKGDAEAHLGATVSDAVITVPAYFDDARRRATQRAGELAGLNVLRVLNEPTAAALSFGLGAQARGTYIVFDLGGGTFDVTVLRINGDEFDVLATEGLHELGGIEWDERLMQLINAEVTGKGGSDLLADPAGAADLRERAELAKRTLSQARSARVALNANGTSVLVNVTRHAFEAATVDLLNQTRDLTESIVGELGLGWTEIHGVLLAGGATRMPMVRTMIEGIVGRPPMRAGNPDEMVALGAAIQGGLHLATRRAADIQADGRPAPPPRVAGRRVRVSDVTSHGLGTIALDEHRVPRNYVLIPRNSKVPAQRSEVFHTVTDRQPDVRITVTQGDDDDPEFVKRLGPEGGRSFPLPPCPAGTPVRITYSYDIDQTVHVEVTELATHSMIGTFEVDE